MSEAAGNIRRGKAALVAGGLSVALVAVGCGGGEDFANVPRPPSAVELTGVISDAGVTLSPKREGAGPVRITVANQTDRALTVTLEGEDVEARVGPVAPQDTAEIQKTLTSGTYEVRAGSSRAVNIEDQIAPATLEIGPERDSSDGELLLP
jgi:hypothetical protein